MKQYYECVVVYDKAQDDGTSKKTSEHYLFEAGGYGDAEERCTKEMTPFISGEFDIKDVKRKKYSEVIKDEGEIYYLCRIAVMVMDEKSGEEKPQNITILLLARNFTDAVDKLKESMKDSGVFEIVSVGESNILEIFDLE